MQPLSAEAFFALVWPRKLLTNERLELRLRRRSDNAIKRVFCSSVQEFLIKAKFYSPHWDAYFGVATRYGDLSGKKRDCYRVCTTWSDIDRRKIEDCVFKPPPDILVSSGSGVHSYWRLTDPFLVRGEGEKWEPIEAVNRALAQKFKGDHNTIDIARVLRVPGTLNHKTSPAREVKAFAV
jgi:hypothetical protein